MLKVVLMHQTSVWINGGNHTHSIIKHNHERMLRLWQQGKPLMGTGTISWWHTFEGAGKYAAILADSSKRAGYDQIRSREKICANCPSSTMAEQKDNGQWLCFCGPPLQESTDPPTCGCLVLAKPPFGIGATITIHGQRWRGIGKVQVADEKCPQGKW
jgi:hypothetical protein